MRVRAPGAAVGRQTSAIDVMRSIESEQEVDEESASPQDAQPEPSPVDPPCRETRRQPPRDGRASSALRCVPSCSCRDRRQPGTTQAPIPANRSPSAPRHARPVAACTSATPPSSSPPAAAYCRSARAPNTSVASTAMAFARCHGDASGKPSSAGATLRSSGVIQSRGSWGASPRAGPLASRASRLWTGEEAGGAAGGRDGSAGAVMDRDCHEAHPIQAPMTSLRSHGTASHDPR